MPKNGSKKAAVRKITLSSNQAAGGGTTVRLRPFIPNRYLPSERELQKALVAEKARFDLSADAPSPEPAPQGIAEVPLSGGVSGYWARQAPSAYDQYLQKLPSAAARQIKSAAMAVAKRGARVLPGQEPVLPETFAQAPPVLPFIPEPPASRAASPIVPDFSLSMPVQSCQSGAVSASRRSPQSSSSCLVQAPVLSPQESAMLDRQVELNKPGYSCQSFNGDMSGSVMDNPSNGAGPPPFPLNLLPMNAMQNLSASRGQHRSPAAQARFGSWHSGASLPESGFHSYLPRRPVATFNYVRVSASTSAVNRKVSARKKNTRLVSSRTVMDKASPRQTQLTVAAYPPYASSQSRPYMF